MEIDKNFYITVVKADIFGYDEIKKKTLEQFINIMNNSISPLDARRKLKIEEDIKDIKESFVLETWNDLKNSFDGFWNRFRFFQKSIDDNSVMSCTGCKNRFTIFNRRHHCRSCGKVFCGNCSNKKIVVPEELISYRSYNLYNNEDRVCNNCYNEIIDYNQLKYHIDFLKIGAFDLKILWHITLLNIDWKKAVIFYLSLMRENIHKFSRLPLKNYEKSFLIKNIHNFIGHNCWTVNILRIENTYNLINIKKEVYFPCSFTICSSNCKNDIGILEYIRILSGGYSDICIELIIGIIKKELDNDKFTLLLPYIFGLCEDKYLPILFERSDNFNIFNLMYWLLVIKCETKRKRRYELMKNNLILLNVNFAKIFNYNIKFIGILEENYNNIEAIRKTIQTIDIPFPSPFDLNKNIIGIESNLLKRSESASSPIFIYYQLESTKELQCLLFKKEDVRKDLYVSSIIKIFRDILYSEGIDIPLVTYKIIPTAINNGIIEIVKNSKTLYDIFMNGSLYNYLQSTNQNITIKDVFNNFIYSFAFWTVVSYLIGIGDRHLENIMVTNEGILFHIDFGFVLGSETKPYAPLVRMDNMMIEALGGSSKISEFIDICCNIYLCLRKYVNNVYPLYMIFINDDPKLDIKMSEKELISFIDSRFYIGHKDEEAKKHMIYIIESSKDTFSQKISDYIHSYKSISKENHSWFSYWK